GFWHRIPITGRKCLSFGQWNTLLPEVEAIVNSRPLAYLPADLESMTVIKHYLSTGPSRNSRHPSRQQPRRSGLRHK
uniref:IS4 family transposase n=1 Tax=Steinernema glaseri TaxID=37863 RepID=A0A1I8AB64_9BILA